MTAALRQLLLGIDHPYVQADYPNDLRLFEVVLAGFDTVADERTACDAFPSPVMTLMVREGRTTALLEDWFQRDDGEQLPAVHDNDRSYDTSDRALQAGRELGRRVIDRAG